MPKKVATMKIKLKITANKNVFDEMGIFWAETADQNQTERKVEFLKNIAFAAAVSMNQSFGYLPSEQDDIKSLRELHGALCNGGILIIDLFNRERLIKQSKANSKVKLREYPSFFLQQTRSVEANGQTLHDSWGVLDKADGQQQFFEHVAHLYTKESLQGMLEKTGFKVQAVYGDYEGQSFGADSSRLIMVAAS